MTRPAEAQLSELCALCSGPDGADPEALLMVDRRTVLALLDEVIAARAEIADLCTSVIAFGGPWAADYARSRGLPDGHLHPTHYEILARAGARMDSFTRAEEGAAA